MSYEEGTTFLFTSESVNEGHPDKICDQVSDAVLDACIKEDENARVACETCTKTGMVMIFGEISTTATINFEQVVKDALALASKPHPHKVGTSTNLKPTETDAEMEAYALKIAESAIEEGIAEAEKEAERKPAGEVERLKARVVELENALSELKKKAHNDVQALEGDI